MTAFLFWVWLILTLFLLWEIRMDIKIVRADVFDHRIEWLKAQKKGEANDNST